MEKRNIITIKTASRYIQSQSDPKKKRYVFAYTITIENRGSIPAKLLSRHWLIMDSNGKIQEVFGEGVVGEQPHLKPGEGFQYTSAALIETPVGVMRGDYKMLADDGEQFSARVPEFTLAIPRTLH